MSITSGLVSWTSRLQKTTLPSSGPPWAGSDVTGTGTPSSSTHTLTLALELPSGDITSVNSAHSPVNRIRRSAGVDVRNVTLSRVTGWGCVLSMTSMVEAETWILSAGVGGGFCAPRRRHKPRERQQRQHRGQHSDSVNSCASHGCEFSFLLGRTAVECGHLRRGRGRTLRVESQRVHRRALRWATQSDPASRQFTALRSLCPHAAGVIVHPDGYATPDGGRSPAVVRRFERQRARADRHGAGLSRP